MYYLHATSMHISSAVPLWPRLTRRAADPMYSLLAGMRQVTCSPWTGAAPISGWLASPSRSGPTKWCGPPGLSQHFQLKLVVPAETMSESFCYVHNQFRGTLYETLLSGTPKFVVRCKADRSTRFGKVTCSLYC